MNSAIHCLHQPQLISASPELVFFLDRWMDTFFLIEAQVDAETGPSADPRTSRARPYASVWSFEPRVNVFGDLRDRCTFISHVWSPFHCCGANLRSIASGADFIKLKHHILTERCFNIAVSTQVLWMGLFGSLSRCAIAFTVSSSLRRFPRIRKILDMKSEVSSRFLCPQRLCLALSDHPHGFTTQHAIPTFSHRI